MKAIQIDKNLRFIASDFLAGEKTSEVAETIKEHWNSDFQSDDILKKANQRLIVRVAHKETTIIFKLFPLKKITSKLRHRKYARQEFLNYQKVHQLQVSSPECYGFVEQRSAGLVCCSGVIMSDLSDATDALKLSQSTPYEIAAEKCIPALSALYNKGVNHIDAREENILLSGENWTLIDWQYANFVKPRSEWLLEHLAAYFIHKAPSTARNSLQDQWLTDLHRDAKHPQSDESFKKRVARLLSKHQGKRARLRLRPC